MSQLQALFVDLAEEDGITAAQIATLQQAAPPWTGVILQACNGVGTFPDWFPGAWKAAASAGGSYAESVEYGLTKFRMAYGYYVVGDDPVAQADAGLDAVESAGGFSGGDLAFGVDIERGEQPGGVTAAQVEDGMEAYSSRVLSRTGRRPILYAGSMIRDLGIKSRLGCAYLWIPEWDDELGPGQGRLDWDLVTEMGWDAASTLMWQDVGDGSDTAAPGYPHTVAPLGSAGDRLDIDIVVLSNLPYERQIAWLQSYCKQA